ncbi:MAG: altronate dehydratase small subunit [Kosmotogales bacterium]|nr:altronate dehydratase small subunit [Kosmotogales bacterium]
MKQAISLSKNDNVATVLEEILKGEEVSIKGLDKTIIVIAKESIPAGHKIAVNDIEKSQIIIKYDNVIGRSMDKIKKGFHVHVHNVASCRTESNNGGE